MFKQDRYRMLRVEHSDPLFTEKPVLRLHLESLGLLPHLVLELLDDVCMLGWQPWLLAKFDCAVRHLWAWLVVHDLRWRWHSVLLHHLNLRVWHLSWHPLHGRSLHLELWDGHVPHLLVTD